MFTNNLSSTTIGWFGIATGIVGLLGFVFIILFFTVIQFKLANRWVYYEGEAR